MAVFEFELVSPEKLLFSGEVESVTASGTEGEFTVMKDHAPFMTTLRPGWVKIKGGGKDETLFVRGGFADVAPTGFTILADYAVPESALDVARLDADIEAADKASEHAIGDETKRLALEQRDHLREFKATLGR
jgi:F-type H+-transporting ATPase subunit epsilon